MTEENKQRAMRFLSLPGDNRIDSFDGSNFFKESAIQTEVSCIQILRSDWSTFQNPVGDSPKRNRKPTPKRNKSKMKNKSKGQDGSQRSPPPYYSERASADSDDRDQDKRDRGKRDRDRPMVHERQTIHEKIYYL